MTARPVGGRRFLSSFAIVDNERSHSMDLEAAVEQFDVDGYAIIRDVIPADLVGEAREHVEWLQRGIPSFAQRSSTTR